MSIRTGLFLLFFCIPLQVMATDSEVAQWTSQVLGKTLSVNYKQTAAQVNEPRKYYSFNGWTSVASFLGDKMLVIRSNKLTLHPEPVNAAKVVNTEEYAGMKYWRVNQSWRIPELDTQVDFSVLVIRTKPGYYQIDSLNMHKKDTSFDP